MEMFDSVFVQCVCDHEVEFQSKSGACVLGSYTSVNVPDGIGSSLDGIARECGDCGRMVTLTYHPPAIKGYLTVEIEDG